MRIFSLVLVSGHLGFFIRVLSACVQHPCCLNCGESVISEESLCKDQNLCGLCEWWNTYAFYFKYKWRTYDLQNLMLYWRHISKTPKFSVADPECLSWIRIFSIPDPGSNRSRIRIKDFKYV